LESKIIIATAVMLASALLFGRLGKFFKLPNVTGYLIAGLLLGPSFLNIIPMNMVNGFSVISDMALAFIAFSVGCEFDLKYYRKVGGSPILIAITEACGAIVVVTVTLILLGFDVKLAIMLGAIAAATAPAQTIMVINQYKAKGPLIVAHVCPQLQCNGASYRIASVRVEGHLIGCNISVKQQSTV